MSVRSAIFFVKWHGEFCNHGNNNQKHNYYWYGTPEIIQTMIETGFII
jgi:hypothetical protein